MLSVNLAISDQSLLIQQLKCIFPESTTHINAREQSNLKYPSTGGYVELDVWIPDHSLCFEFQDAHHYVTTYYYQKARDVIQRKDDTKKQIAHQNGMYLVEVPCWWDGSVERLVASIRFQRPDLLLDWAYSDNPIPLTAPRGFFKGTKSPEVGELMLASFPQDSSHVDLAMSDWWMGEKYDGIRCYWHPLRRNVYSRAKREIMLHESVINSLPPIFIDSELWFGRGMYSKSYTLLLADFNHVTWDSLRMVAFDEPSTSSQGLPFEYRYSTIFHHLPSSHPFVIQAARIYIKSSPPQIPDILPDSLLASSISPPIIPSSTTPTTTSSLSTSTLALIPVHTLGSLVERIISYGGEGVILRRAGSLYEPGRSNSLIKLKAAPGDREGIVTAIDDQKSVHLKLPNGTTFVVPARDVQITNDLKIGLGVGSVVTFSYEAHSRRDVPVNPTIYRIRTDVDWTDITQHEARERRQLTELSNTAGFTSKALGHWTEAHMRQALMNVARERGMDPLRAETWYHIPYKELNQFRTIFQKLKGYSKTLQYLFPDIDFDNSQFPKSSWGDIVDRRKFFENYAREAGFDPYTPENWYSLQIKSIKGAKAITTYHNDSISTALIDLFPDVPFDPTKFLDQRPWKDTRKTREFFESFARVKGFDPRVADNWYKVSKRDILSTKGVKAVLRQYPSMAVALLHAFPNIGIKKKYIWSLAPSKKPRRREVFENYAKVNGFDPLFPENWYSQSKKKILAFPGVREVVSHHDRVAKCIIRLFPNIGLERKKFWNSTKDFRERSKRRECFENYAQVHNFDARDPENWYKVDKDNLMSFKGVSDVLSYYKGSIARALVDLFPDIGVDKSKLSNSPWHNVENRRKFFEQYAAANEFDHRIPTNWYSHSREKIKLTPGAKEVISFHGYSVSRALIELFPELPFSKQSFKLDKSLVLEKTPWYYPENRKNFFLSFAKESGFDALVPGNWYSQSRSKIKSQKGARRVLYYHNRSVSQALVELFPDIGLQKSQFKRLKT